MLKFPDANAKPLDHQDHITCGECGGDGWGPMLTTKAWLMCNATNSVPRYVRGDYARECTFLCEPCMEVKLGRPLTSDDLRDCPMNHKHRLYTPAKPGTYRWWEWRV